MKGRTIYPGTVEGEAIVSKEPIGFYGGIDAKTGEVIEKGHELEGQKKSSLEGQRINERRKSTFEGLRNSEENIEF